MTTSHAFAASPSLVLSEPTVQDLALANVLGYERPTTIRKLIKRHAASLEAMGSLRHRGVMIVAGKGAQRSVTEYHLTKAQAAFIIAKAGTKRADSLAIAIAEIFAMVLDTKLVPANGEALVELEAISARETERRQAIQEEEREARSDAFALLGRGSARRRRRRSIIKVNTYPRVH